MPVHTSQVPLFSPGSLRWVGLLVSIALLLVLLPLGGWLFAQQHNRGLPPPPESRFSSFEPAGSNLPAEFVLARMAYTDLYGYQLLERRPWRIDSPEAERHFLQGVKRLSRVDARSKEEYVHPIEEKLFEYPFLYVVEVGHWDLTDIEVENIREYLLRGGFIMFDDFHGSQEWDIFMLGMRRIFPGRPVEDLGNASEVFHVLFDMEHREQIPGLQMLYSGQPYERTGEGFMMTKVG